MARRAAPAVVWFVGHLEGDVVLVDVVPLLEADLFGARAGLRVCVLRESKKAREQESERESEREREREIQRQRKKEREGERERGRERGRERERERERERVCVCVCACVLACVVIYAPMKDQKDAGRMEINTWREHNNTSSHLCCNELL